MTWEIRARPDPEFKGDYPWHVPATDPAQYQIELKPEHGDPEIPIWVLWPSGNVYMWTEKEYIHIGMVKQMEEDGEPHSWMFEGLTTEEAHYISRRWDDGEKFIAYYDLIEEELDTIVTDSVHDWPTE